MNEVNNRGEILIIEDDVIISRLHKFGIEKHTNVTIRTLNNGKQALDYLEKEAPPSVHALILLDLNMPEMNGWEFLKTCEQIHAARDLKVIIVTSSPHKMDIERVNEFDSVIGYYMKPLRSGDIAEIFSIPEVIAMFGKEADTYRHSGT